MAVISVYKSSGLVPNQGPAQLFLQCLRTLPSLLPLSGGAVASCSWLRMLVNTWHTRVFMPSTGFIRKMHFEIPDVVFSPKLWNVGYLDFYSEYCDILQFSAILRNVILLFKFRSTDHGPAFSLWLWSSMLWDDRELSLCYWVGISLNDLSCYLLCDPEKIVTHEAMYL